MPRTSDTDLPPFLPPRVPATWPSPLPATTLDGAVVRLEPLTPDTAAASVDALVASAADPRIWHYLTSDGTTPSSVRVYVANLVEDWRAGRALPFLVRMVNSTSPWAGQVVGATRLKDIDREHRSLAVGSWLARDAWGSGANAEAKGLLLAHAFEELGALRVAFDTDRRNARSRAALTALGATEEGILRAHRITRTGERRDSVVFSVIAEEWPDVRRRIAARVAKQARLR